MPIALIVHGGAGDLADDQVQSLRRGVELAARAGWEVLLKGGSALDAVEESIVTMEDDPIFDAGTGSVLNQDGVVEMDAGIMDGRTLDAGAVAGIRRVKNPIRLARRVLESEHTFLIGEGAERFAQGFQIPLIDNAVLRTPAQIARWKEFLTHPPEPPQARYVPPQGTVGCVAVDGSGNVAAGTSTGGTRFKLPGRVGDSPLIGCGVYADGSLGAASATGWGEAITRVVLCKHAVSALAAALDPNDVSRSAIEYLARRVGGTGGIILIDPSGHIGCSYNTPRMARAIVTETSAGVRAFC